MTKPKKQKIVAFDTFDAIAFTGYNSPCGLDDSQLGEMLETIVTDSADYLEQNNHEIKFLMHGITDEYLENAIFDMSEAHQKALCVDINEPIQRYEIKLTVALEIIPKESYHVEYVVPKPKKEFKITKVKK